MHEPAIGGLAVTLHPGQPDLVALTLDVQRMGAADVGDPDAGRHRGHQARPPGESPAGRHDQVDSGTPAEYQPCALGDQHLLPRRRANVRAQWHSKVPDIWHNIGLV